MLEVVPFYRRPRAYRGGSKDSLHLLSPRSDLHHRFFALGEFPGKTGRMESGVSEIKRKVRLSFRLALSRGSASLTGFPRRTNKTCRSIKKDCFSTQRVA